MTDSSGFNNLVPGFDFLQTLVKNAGAAMPGIGQWVAPTIDPDELAKRIDELRTVQFWLEQNARMLGATIQAMEVQRMTLSTLKTMNVQMGDLRDALTVSIPGMTAPAKAAPAPSPAAASATAPAEDAAPRPQAIDPMQWWGALTRQFTELATQAMRDPALVAAAPGGAPAAPTADSGLAERSGGASAVSSGNGPRSAARPASPRKAGTPR